MVGRRLNLRGSALPIDANGDESIVTGKRSTSDRKTAPLSHHPAFPAIVAVWFAALFGIGTMIVPVILLERGVQAIGLSALIPAAAPPLGFTARLAVSLAAACLGVAIGLFVARRIAMASAYSPKNAPATPSLARAIEQHPKKRPILAHEELGEEGLGPDEAVAEQAPSPAFLQSVAPQAIPAQPVIAADTAPEATPALDAQSAADEGAGSSSPLGEMPLSELFDRFALSLTRHAPPVRTGGGKPCEIAAPCVAVRPFDTPSESRAAMPLPSAIHPALGTAPAETERALRDALAALQRMSGAA